MGAPEPPSRICEKENSRHLNPLSAGFGPSKDAVLLLTFEVPERFNSVIIKRRPSGRSGEVKLRDTKTCELHGDSVILPRFVTGYSTLEEERVLCVSYKHITLPSICTDISSSPTAMDEWRRVQT